MIRAIAVLLVIASLCGCSVQPAILTVQSEDMPVAYDTEPVLSTLLQGSPSGVWFMLSNGISECINRTYPGSILQITPGAGTTNVDRLLNGEAELILAHQTYAISAMEGTGTFSEAHPEMMGIASFYSSSAQLVVREDLEISTFEEIVMEKIPLRLSLGAKGNINEIAFLQLLQVYDLSIEQMEAWGCTFYQKTQDQTQNMFADGTIDGYFLTVSAPSPTIVENSANNPMVLVSFSEDKILQICEIFGYEPSTILPGTYNFLNSEYPTFANYTILATTSATDAEVVYKVTKAICENLDYLRLIHASLSDIDKNSLLQDLKLPLHPGAMEYYKEAGFIE